MTLWRRRLRRATGGDSAVLVLLVANVAMLALAVLPLS